MESALDIGGWKALFTDPRGQVAFVGESTSPSLTTVRRMYLSAIVSFSFVFDYLLFNRNIRTEFPWLRSQELGGQVLSVNHVRTLDEPQIKLVFLR